MWLFLCHVWSEFHFHIRIWESVEKKDERFFCLCQWPKPHSCTLSRLRNYRKTINVIPFPPVSSETFGIERKKEISFRSASLSQASACRLCMSHVNWCWFGVLWKKKKGNGRMHTAFISKYFSQRHGSITKNHAIRLYIAIYSFYIFGLHSMEAHFRHIRKKTNKNMALVNHNYEISTVSNYEILRHYYDERKSTLWH